MAAIQTGSNTIASHRTTRNKIPAPTPIFSMSVGSTTVDGCHIYFRYNTTSGCVGDNVVESGDIENMDVGVKILFVAVLYELRESYLVCVGGVNYRHKPSAYYAARVRPYI